MKFVPAAIVYHTHPDTLGTYLKKKYKFAYWRVLAVRKNPNKTLKDSHTPQLMKLQVLFAPALLVAIFRDLVVRPNVPTSLLVCAAFLVSTSILRAASHTERSHCRAVFSAPASRASLCATAGCHGRLGLRSPQACRGRSRVARLSSVCGDFRDAWI